MAENTTKKPARIFYYVDDFYGCGWYRCHVPGRALQARGHEVILKDSISPADLIWADVAVFQRKHSPDDWRAVQFANEHGARTVYEVDDDLYNVHPSNPAYGYWSRPQVRSDLAQLIRSCAAVTTTNTYLADSLGKINGNVFVTPNMLPDEYWSFARPKEQTEDRVTIGWAGSSSHFPDLGEIVPVIVQVLDTYPNAEFLFAGDKAPFAVHERARQLEVVRLEAYPWLLRAFHIGLAPLIDSNFNRSRSDLKCLEYAASGIPVIASKVLPYMGSIEDGRTGFLARNPKDWLKDLTNLVEDVELRREIGRRAQGWARTRFANRNTAPWEMAYGLED